VVDRWPLVRLGLVGVLVAGGIEVVGQAAKASEGLLLARLHGVDLVVFGSPVDGLSPTAIRGVKLGESPPRIMVLVSPSNATQSGVNELFAAGADALLVASAGPDELADALLRVGKGERVVGSELGPKRPAGTRRRGPDTAPVAGRVPAAGRPPPDEDAVGRLTAKEREVLALLAQGHSNKQIARALYVSEATVKTHLQHMYGKLAVQNRFGALSRAAELGLLG